MYWAPKEKEKEEVLEMGCGRRGGVGQKVRDMGQQVSVFCILYGQPAHLLPSTKNQKKRKEFICVSFCRFVGFRSSGQGTQTQTQKTETQKQQQK